MFVTSSRIEDDYDESDEFGEEKAQWRKLRVEIHIQHIVVL